MIRDRNLTPREIEQISKHDGRTYKFDLSRISGQMFDALIVSLQEQFSFGIEGLGFSNDLMMEELRKHECSQIENPYEDQTLEFPLVVQCSAIKTKADLSETLAKNLDKIMLQYKTLLFLKFRFISFKPNEIDILSNAIFNNCSLRTLKLCDVPLGDEEFGKLCRALVKKNLFELQFRKCSLTDSCVFDLRSLLSSHAYIHSDVSWKDRVIGSHDSEAECIHIIDLRQNNLTMQFIEIIKDTILNLPLKVFDLRGNPKIPRTKLRMLQRMFVNIDDMKCGFSKPPKSKMGFQFQEINDRSTISMIEERTKRIQYLEEENERLQSLINELENGVNVTELEDNLMLVGPDSDLIANYITKLDHLIAKMRNGPKPFLSSLSLCSTKLSPKVIRKRKSILKR